MENKELIFRVEYKDFNCSEENFKCIVTFRSGLSYQEDIEADIVQMRSYHSKIGDFNDTTLLGCDNIITNLDIQKEYCDITVQFFDRGNIYKLIGEKGVDAFKVKPSFTTKYPIMFISNYDRCTEYHTFWFDGLVVDFNWL